MTGMGHAITCTSVSRYEGALTRGQQYELLAEVTDDEQNHWVKVRGDNARTRWFPANSFDLSGGSVPVAVEWRFDDPVRDDFNGLDETNNGVDVTIRLSDGQRRWMHFMTPEFVKGLLDGQSEPAAVFGNHVVVIRDLLAETVGGVLTYLDQNDELIMHSLPIEGEDEPEEEPQFAS
jgi:hypothetical protein